MPLRYYIYEPAAAFMASVEVWLDCRANGPDDLIVNAVYATDEDRDNLLQSSDAHVRLLASIAGEAAQRDRDFIQRVWREQDEEGAAPSDASVIARQNRLTGRELGVGRFA